MYKHCHISASTAPRHFKIGTERAYTIIYHKMDVLAEAITLAIIWPEIVTKGYDELCDKISRSSLPLKTDSVDITLQHMLRHGSLYFFSIKIPEF